MTSENKIFSVYFKVLLILTLASIVLRTTFPVHYGGIVDRYCEEYGVERELAFALIKAESNFSEDVVSSASAKGLMQLTDSTFSYCMVTIKRTDSGDIFDPEQNINAGIWYLSLLLERYDGNVNNAVAAYNAGPANVDKWLRTEDFSIHGKIPFPETERHVGKIDRYRKIYKLLY